MTVNVNVSLLKILLKTRPCFYNAVANWRPELLIYQWLTFAHISNRYNLITELFNASSFSIVASSLFNVTIKICFVTDVDHNIRGYKDDHDI